MKKQKSLLVLAAGLSFLLSSCASLEITVNPEAYVQEAENFERTEVTKDKINDSLKWQNYSIRFYNYKDTVNKDDDEKNEKGIGLIYGKILSKGIFERNDKMLYTVELKNNVKGLSNKTSSFKSSITSSNYTLITGFNSKVYDINEEENISFKIDDDINMKFEDVKEYISKSGKITKSWGALGTKVMINDELYCVINFTSKTKNIRLNNNFTQEFSDEKKDYISSIILLMYYYYSDFRSKGYDLD